jgi:carboxylesterase
MPAPVLEGAEPFSAAGGPHGVLVVHGFTGNPQSMRGLAEAFAGAGFSVELPLLPGHGTHIDDMVETAWDDWSGAAEVAFSELQSRCDKVVVAGLSMGGTVATWLASRHPDIAGLVAINPAMEPPGDALVDILRQTLAEGTTVMPAIGNDVADPDQQEMAYDGMPVAALLSLLEAQVELAPRLGDVRCPTLLFTSRQDHVVPPANSDYLAAHVGGPVERVFLERSYHVATLDYDRGEIESRSVAFAQQVTGTPTSTS